MTNTNVTREALEVVKAAEHVTTVEGEHAVQRQLQSDMKSMSPADYKKLIDEVVGINAKDRILNSHLPQLFPIHQPGKSNSENIGFSFSDGQPIPDDKVAKEFGRIQTMIEKGGKSSSPQVVQELESAQRTLSLGEFRELYSETYKAESGKGYPNPLKPVDDKWRFQAQ